jgi:hypothetical protein
MIQSNLQIAFTVSVLHSYFEEGVCNCLQFKPGAVTQALLKRFGFGIRNRVNGFDFYVNTRDTLGAFLNYISSSMHQDFFDFDIVTNNSNFTYFTSLPVNWVGQLVYDSNAAANTSAVNGLQLAESLTPPASPACLGKLTLWFDDILKLNTDKGAAQFIISYNARATQWQYFFINKSAVQLNNPAITGKTNIVFEGPENVTIKSGQQAILFSSGNQLIPLSQVPRYKFDLVNNPLSSAGDTAGKRPAPKIILKGLPNPDAGRIGRVSIDQTSQLSSPMYVYL